MGERITRAELARRLGISRQTVHEHFKKGNISLGDDGLVDFELARQEYLHNTDAGKRSRTSQVADEVAETVGLDASKREIPAPLGDFNRVKLQKEEAAAQLAIHKLKIARGNVVSRSEVQAQEFAIARMVRDRILGWPAKLANHVPPDAMSRIEIEARALIRDIKSDIQLNYGSDDDAETSA